MAHALILAHCFLDPRGRCSRKGLLAAALVLVALQAVAAVGLWSSHGASTGNAALVVNGLFCWMGLALVGKRLHDLGRSLWWVPTAVLVWLAGAVSLAVVMVLLGDPQMLARGAAGYWMAFGAMLAPLLVTGVWLQVAEGDVGANRYGPAPGASGFTMPAGAAAWLHHEGHAAAAPSA